MKTENRPNAALINREWYESAASVLEGRKLAQLVLYAVQYVLYGISPETEDETIKIVFAMVRPALDSDIAKYLERCARNAANAKSQRQRVGASGSEWERVAANTTTTTTTTPTTTTTTTTSISNEDERKRGRFLCYGYFWATGSNDPMQELDAYWDYYEALGWKNNKGAAIVSKIAAARMWRRQFDSSEPKQGAQSWFKAVKDCPIIDTNVFRCYAGAEMADGKVTIHLLCSARFLDQLQEVVPNLKGSLMTDFRAQEVIFVTR